MFSKPPETWQVQGNAFKIKLQLHSRTSLVSASVCVVVFLFQIAKRKTSLDLLVLGRSAFRVFETLDWYFRKYVLALKRLTVKQKGYCLISLF
jgi:hypothetical protein